MVPAIAAARSGQATSGSCRALLKFPARPASEFTRMKTTETAAMFFVRAQCLDILSGVRKIPPPLPVSPAKPNAFRKFSIN